MVLAFDKDRDRDKDRRKLLGTHIELIEDAIIWANCGIVGYGSALKAGKRVHRLCDKK